MYIHSCMYKVYVYIHICMYVGCLLIVLSQVFCVVCIMFIICFAIASIASR